MLEIINHLELAESRLATQFKNSTKLINYINALLNEADTLEQVFNDIIDSRSIDNANGKSLDMLGAIVGQSRVLVDATALYYFGFKDDPTAQSFGDLNDPGAGGRFRSVDELTTGNRRLTDSEYRMFIRSRIVKNNVTPTYPEVEQFLKDLLNVQTVNIIEGTMVYIVQFGRILTNNEKVFILNTELIPKPAAVGVSYQEYDGQSAFGFLNDPESVGFGDVNDSNVGGKFSSIIQ